MKKSLLILCLLSVFTLAACDSDSKLQSAQKYCDKTEGVLSQNGDTFVCSYSDGSTCEAEDFSNAGCINVNSDSEDESIDNEEDNLQIVNPWSYNLSVEEADKIAGFSIETPVLDDLGAIEHNAMAGLTEVRYSGEGLPEGQYVTIRKGAKSEINGDVSGDYNNYEIVTDAVIGELNVTLKSHENEEGIKLVTWKDGEYNYAISFPEASAVDLSLVEYIVQNVK